MKYVFEFLFTFLVAFVGCELAILIVGQRVKKCRCELKKLKASLTSPESYIWIDVEDHLPECDGEYLIEYVFVNSSLCRFCTVRKFYADERRFQYEDPRETKVIRWADLPK